MGMGIKTEIKNNEDIAEKKERMGREGMEYLLKGRKLFIDSNLSEAVSCLQKAAGMLDIAEDYRNYCDAMNLLGVIMNASGNALTSLDYYLDGLEVANTYGVDVSSISILNNIGSGFQKLGANERALECILKAMKILESIPLDTDERFPLWKVIMEVNICNAYRRLGKLETAKLYMNRMESYKGWVNGDENFKLFYFSFRITQASLRWEMGLKDEVLKDLPELVELAMNDGNVSDYVQDIEEFLELLKKAENRTYWEMVLQSFEQYAKNQESLKVKIVSIEKWIEFFKYYEMTEKYKEACVLYTELALELRANNKKELISAMEMKIDMREKEAATRKYQKLASVDPLSGIGNRNKLETDSKILLENAKENGEFIGIGLFDLDHFKAKNDTYGHIVGDACIKCLVRALKKSLGSLKYAYRFGGDEFVVLLKGTTRDEIVSLAERVKSTLYEEQRKDKDLKKIEEITLSQGYAFGIPEEGDTFIDILETADKALYRVKENGRNGYSIYDHMDIMEYSIH